MRLSFRRFSFLVKLKSRSGNRYHPNFVFAILLCLGIVRIEAATYRLSSQTWQNLVGGGVVHSPYDYDAQGLRIQRRDYNSADSSGPIVSRTVWQYDNLGRVVAQIQFSATDTLSVLRQNWGAKGVILATVWGKGGVQRYRDTTMFDATGLKICSRRLSSKDSLVSSQTWAYDGLGQLVADTTWQPQADALIPVLVTETHWLDGFVSWIQESSRSLGSTRWNPSQRTEMSWNGSRLISTTNLSNDGTGRLLVDSTSYEYDAAGNRSTETTFDADRVASNRITYVWTLIASTIVGPRPHEGSSWTISGGQLRIDSDQRPMEIIILDPRGRVVVRAEGSSKSVSLIGLPRGRYLGHVKFADHQSTHAFTTLP